MRPIQEIPPNLTPDQLTLAMNSRLREIELYLKEFLANPAESELDMAYQRIANMGDPRNDLDAVNLRTLRRAFPATTEETTQAAGTGDQHYTVVFTRDGFPDSGDISPAFTINENREGVPLCASVTADEPPLTGPLRVLLEVEFPPLSAGKYLHMFIDVPINETGPVYGVGFVQPFPIVLTKGCMWRMTIIASADAGKIVGEIVMRRT